MFEGLVLCKFNIPFKTKPLEAVTPPVPLIVKLFTVFVKIEAGSVMAEVLEKTKVAPELLASMFPFVLIGVL